MGGVEAALWGLFGGFAVEGLDLYSALRRRGCWPWLAKGPAEAGVTGYVIAETVRLLIGGGLAWAAATSHQITSSIGALTIGVAAPLIVERLTRAIPLTDPQEATAPDLPQVQQPSHVERETCTPEPEGDHAC